MSESQKPEPSPPEASEPGDREPRRRIQSGELLAGAEEVLIEHEGQTYRLRLTRRGKLILHK